MRHIATGSSIFTLLLGFIAGLPALSIDLSAPTLAILPAALHTSVFVAGLSLSLFVLGFGAGQFVGGRGSDRFGRRPALLAALTIYAFAGVCCAIATSGGQLATGRLLQGIGAGACSVQASAMVQDLFAGEIARRKQAYVSVVLTLVPMLAPAIGALILKVASWRSIHAALAVAGGLLLLTVMARVGESRPPVPGRGIGMGLAASRQLLRDRVFGSVVAVNALSYAATFAYIAGGPVVIIAQFGYGDLVYAAVFACTALALSLGAVTSARLTHRLDTRALVRPALFLQTVANIGMVAAALAPHPADAWLSLSLLVCTCFARGIVSPNLVHAAISKHREQAGLASALVGLAQLLMAALSSALLARVIDRFGLLSMAMMMAVLTVAAALLWRLSGVGEAMERQAAATENLDVALRTPNVAVQQGGERPVSNRGT